MSRREGERRGLWEAVKGKVQKTAGRQSQRVEGKHIQKEAGFFLAAVLVLAAITLAGEGLWDGAMVSDFSKKNLKPCLSYPFGTDWMGRDVFLRTICGLSLSIRIGCLTAGISAVIAFFMGIFAAMGKWADYVVCMLIDLVMGIPHMLLLVLISFAVGKGLFGVIVGISLTHWTSLARLIRGEVLGLKKAPYMKISLKLGTGRLQAAVRHMTPHLLPQVFVGAILLFPHAILHEAGITFLGFGLSPEQPAVGIILSESMRYLAMGKWWLSLFPGLMLVMVVILFHYLGKKVQMFF